MEKLQWNSINKKNGDWTIKKLKIIQSPLKALIVQYHIHKQEHILI